MRKPFNLDRRGFLGTAAMTLAAAPFTPPASLRTQNPAT